MAAGEKFNPSEPQENSSKSPLLSSSEIYQVDFPSIAEQLQESHHQSSFLDLILISFQLQMIELREILRAAQVNPRQIVK
jgi:hypothetical protein